MTSLPPALPRWLERAVQVNTTVHVTVPGRENSYRSRIEDVAGRLVAVAIPYERGVPLWVAPGSTIGLMILGPVRPLRMNARLLRFHHKPVPMWVLELPPDDEIESIQRRRAVRVPVLLQAEVRLQADGTEEASAADNPTALEAEVVDISIGGARIVARRHLEVGDRVALRVQFPWGSETLEGRVVFRAPIRETGSGAHGNLLMPRYSYGVEFVDVTPQLEDQICRYVLERQSEMRARGLL